MSLIKRYDKSHANNWAIIIAWNSLISFIPIILALLAIFSLLLNRRGFAVQIESHISALLNTRAERASVFQSLVTFRDHSGELLSVAVVGMMWSGSALFSTLDNGLSHLFGTPARSFILKRIRGMIMVFPFAALLVPLLASSVLISFAERDALLPHLSAPTLYLLQILLGFLMATLLFALIYRIVPNRHLRLSQILPGALVAGILTEMLSLIFPLYIKNSDDLTTYGAAVGLALLAISFFYALGQIIVIGAVVNVELDPELKRILPEVQYQTSPVSDSTKV